MENFKKCPFCGSEINSNAKKCRFCNNWLDEEIECPFCAEKIKASAKTVGFELIGEAVSPIRYQTKNVEYLLNLKK